MASKKHQIMQERFVLEYIVDMNASRAAMAAGYSKKSAGAIGFELLKRPEIQLLIKEKLEADRSGRQATADEVLEFLTTAMRGELTEEMVVVENIGDYESRARVVPRKVVPKDRLKAADALAKRHKLYGDGSAQVNVGVTIIDDIK